MSGMRIVLVIVCLACVAGALAQPQDRAAVEAAEAARGQALYNQHCAICHYDQSTAKKIGPGLKGIYARGKFADGKTVNDAGMVAWIEKGGKDMPGLQDTLKPAEIRTLVNYLKTL